VVPIPTFPVESIATLDEPEVWKTNLSSSLPGLSSATIKVSPSTSLTPPRDPH